MTREEISLKADRLIRDLDRAFMLGFCYQEGVERHLQSLVRATLQEAARAVCVNCARGDVPTPTERFIFGDGVTRWSHSPSITKSGEPDYCQADEIHDLIAALDKEGS